MDEMQTPEPPASVPVLSELASPVFTKRIDNRYQVRFWSDKERYKAFVTGCKTEGLIMQDVFNDLMEYFTLESQAGRIKTRERK